MTVALLVAAPASGQGKTTVAAALARLHARQGKRVRCFKCGPDYLDPMWLTLASGHAVDSLDLWINGEADCSRRLAAAARESDLVIVEGAMGLFDGAPSAADLALRFGLPVLAVIDASAMAGTFAALAHGLRTWHSGLTWAGVIANRVAGAAHGAMLSSAMGQEAAAQWQGHLLREAAIKLPERHLGLAMPSEAADALARMDAAANALSGHPIARSLDQWPRWQAPEPTEPPPHIPRLLRGKRIAIARDAAFAFIYPDNLTTLRALGAELHFFSPLAGEPLPTCDALWLPGGYPELYAARLAACTVLRDQVAAHVNAGRPLWAECGGMMVLAEQLTDGHGQVHEMWGLIPGRAELGRSLAALGPHQLRLPACANSPPLRGHSFHWSRLHTTLAPALHTEPHEVAAGQGEPVYLQGSLRASWFHPWFSSSPQAAARLFGDAPWGGP